MTDLEALTQLRVKLEGNTSEIKTKPNMKKDMTFLGTEGLTSTSANHIANLAKEYIQNIEYTIDSISFYNEKVSIIGNPVDTIISEGNNRAFLDTIPQLLSNIIEAKSLIAWLREGIKAKENVLKSIKSMTTKEYCTLKNIEMVEMPVKEDIMDGNDYLATLSIKERNRYYQLETICATIGKYIHPDGIYSNARKALNDKIAHPNRVVGTGRDTNIYKYHPTVSVDDVDATFFILQDKHRSAQAELNGMKHKMDEAIHQDDVAKTTIYQSEMEGYLSWTDYISNELYAYKLEETKKIGDMKIIIPDNLKSIYETITKLGK